MYSNNCSLVLSQKLQCDLEMLLNGGFHPLNGFMDRNDYESVCESMRLNNNLLWPMPIVLPVTSEWIKKSNLAEWCFDHENKRQHNVILTDEENTPLAKMTVTDFYKPDFLNEAQKVFGTTDSNHPSVKPLVDMANDVGGDWFYLAGPVEVVQQREYFDFVDYRLTPAQVKDFIKEKGWSKVVGFQTRNPMHRSHVELTKYALKQVGEDAKLLLHPVVGMTQECDVDYYIRAKCYTKVIKRYDDYENNVKLCFLPIAMRMGGPREALWHALIRQNYGCTHFIVGRDHAGPSYKKQDGSDFYGPFDAHALLGSLESELQDKYNLTIVKSAHICYVKELDCYLPRNEVPEGMNVLNLSGTEQRRRLTTGEEIPEWFTYPEIVAELRKYYLTENEKGYCIYLTGLSGSGKSTLAKALATKLREVEDKRRVTILDGDVIRHNLSKGLGFSREDRSTNVRRIGYVASEIVKHGGVCIAANIAPYEEDRKYNRELISKYGRYIEVFVDTPIELCEQRDSKGLYKLAREGKIKEFTGISDPYEKPTDCEVYIDGSKIDKRVTEGVEKVIKFQMV